MKIAKWLLVVVFVLAAVLLIGAQMLSPKFKVTRSTVVNAPPERVYGLIDDPREWKKWSVWNRRDPAMQITYSGPPRGTGATWAWKSKSEGDGRMTFQAAEPGRQLGYELYFPDFGTTSTGVLALAPQGTGTAVTWTMDGDMGKNPMYRWIALFADSMVGKDFEAGLANLKAVAEQPQ